MRIRKVFMTIVEIISACVVSDKVGSWAIAYAYYERGYEAVGSEYLLIPFVFCLTYWIMDKILRIGGTINANRQERSRRTFGM